MEKTMEVRFQLSWPSFVFEVDLLIPAQGVTAIFGHSGCGKTTLLRCIAGLEQPKHGYFSLRGEIWQNETICLPTWQRSLGYVFQEASLFPHLNVLGNLHYGLKRIKPTKQQQVRLNQVIELLNIGHLLDRKPAKLSGGERQRVGIARALAVSPSILLMDEPMASLDRKLKQEIMPYLQQLHQELSIPILYVTHSSDEVIRLANHLVVMDEGKVIATGPVDKTLAWLD